ncbi:MAG: glycoside hydrolase family 88 protein [Clostridium sp.]|nr:glycoside hydrolase family 88 protein [Clostridium sp.]
MDKIGKAKTALLAMQRYSWEQGTAMQAFLEAGDDAVVIAMAKEAAYRQIADGRLASIGIEGAVTDPCSNGEGLIHAYKLTGEEDLKKAQEKSLKWALEKAPRNQEGIVYHVDSAPQMWADSVYMLPPYLAAAGEYEEAVKQIRGYLKVLYHEEIGLMSHMWDDEKKVYLREAHWGVGNGWTIAGITRVIAKLPENMEKEKSELIQVVQDIVKGLLKWMREDGMFHDVVDDPETFVEVNCSQMLAYTLFRGMKAGWLSEEYLETAEKLRSAANKCIDEFGLVHPVCGAPSFDKPGTAPEGNAFYILMEAAAKDYYQN